MKCPHCAEGVFFKTATKYLVTDTDGAWGVTINECPQCQRASIWLGTGVPETIVFKANGPRYIVRPQGGTRPVPSEVPGPIAADFTEAVTVLPLSAKASAALSRRCLQSVLEDPNAGAVTHATLFKEIKEVIAANTLPSYALDELHYVREVGNAAAHPMTSGQTGLVYDVKANEAESLLDVLETLFDEYYVKPAASKAKLSNWKQNKPK